MIRLLHHHGIPYAVVGNWTNLIITDKGYRGALICTKGLNGVSILLPENGSREIHAEAGVPLSELVAFTVRENLTGFEFCAGIPGSVGGAIRMNAGAYGHSISESVEAVTLMDKMGQTEIRRIDQLRFEYRNFHLPEGKLIIGAAFRFRDDPEKQVGDRVRQIIEERRSKHPLQYKNAGSIFKNPAGCPAGRLIEEIGLKGFAIGDAMISEKHGNFIVNRGHATSGDVLALIRYVQDRVSREKGTSLELEVKIVGEI
jgi:UDP-N-acetylmuramate dehydrogenase